MIRRFRFALVLTGAALIAPPQLAAEDDPNALPLLGLTVYDGYRALLLERGWEPIDRFPGDGGYTEVSCGNRICIADWRRPDGRWLSFTLWRYYTDDKHLLLLMVPEFEIEE